MPRRDHARPLHAQPLHAQPPNPSNFLPPQPRADRDRRLRFGRKSLIAIAIGVGLALATPVAFGALGPAVGPLQPLSGGVAGAVSGSHEPGPPATPAPVASAQPSEPAPTPTDENTAPDIVPPTAPPVASLTGYRWPITQGRISLPFKAIPGGEWFNGTKLWHDGVDMASFCGARVLAAGRHFDEQIGWLGDLEPYFHHLDARHMWNDLPIVVVIDDGNGYRSIYAHFLDVKVRVGQHVKAGQQIGREGATGHASGCHVHYGLFSPFETKQFGVRADILMHLKLPKHIIARVDPLLVLPGGDVALRTRQIGKAMADAAMAIAAAVAEASDARAAGR